MSTKKDKLPSYFLRCLIASLLVFLGIGFTQLVAYGWIKLGILTEFSAEIKIKTFLITIAQQAIIFTSLAWWFHKRAGTSFFSFGGDLNFSNLMYGIVGLLGVNLFSSLVMQYFKVDIKQLEVLSRSNMAENPALFLSVVAFIAPLYEEFVFRGVVLKMLYSEVEEKIGSPIYVVIAIVFSALLFSLVHFDLDAAFPIFMLGSYFAWVTIRTNSIFLSSILHFIQNFLSGCLFLNEDLLHNLGLAFR